MERAARVGVGRVEHQRPVNCRRAIVLADAIRIFLEGCGQGLRPGAIKVEGDAPRSLYPRELQGVIVAKSDVLNHVDAVGAVCSAQWTVVRCLVSCRRVAGGWHRRITRARTRVLLQVLRVGGGFASDRVGREEGPDRCLVLVGQLVEGASLVVFGGIRKLAGLASNVGSLELRIPWQS